MRANTMSWFMGPGGVPTARPPPKKGRARRKEQAVAERCCSSSKGRESSKGRISSSLSIPYSTAKAADRDAGWGFELAAAAEPAAGGAAPYNDEWEELYDPQSGAPYYYNTVTEETTWERPAACAPPAGQPGLRHMMI